MEVSTSGEPVAWVFKTMSDPYVGRLNFVKIMCGTLTPNTELIDARNGKKIRVGRVYKVVGKRHDRCRSCSCGRHRRTAQA